MHFYSGGQFIFLFLSQLCTAVWAKTALGHKLLPAFYTKQNLPVFTGQLQSIRLLLGRLGPQTHIAPIKRHFFALETRCPKTPRFFKIWLPTAQNTRVHKKQGGFSRLPSMPQNKSDTPKLTKKQSSKNLPCVIFFCRQWAKQTGNTACCIIMHTQRLKK